MTKKEIVVAGILVCGIAVASVGGYFTWVYFQNEKDTQQALLTARDGSEDTSTGTASSSSSGSNELVFSSTDLGQLQNSTPISGGESAKSSDTTSPESFAQYEQYKDAESALYADIQEGTGKAIEKGSKVAVYYKGWLTDGAMFDQTRKGEDGSLQPFMFTVGAQEVIPGMEQAIFGMKTGGTRRLIIPPSVGYGEQGQKDVIPPNSVLVFDVQLVAVQ